MAAGGDRPSVLEVDESWYLPERVYVAACPDGSSGGPMLELRSVGEHGRAAVLAFSSLDEFLSGCGPDQPWMLLPRERLAELAADGQGAFAFSVLLDESLPVELRGTTGGMANDEPRWDLPDSEDWPAVYIPSRPFRPGQERAELELQPMPAERLALMAYSSQRSLEAGCGLEQPWVTIPAGLIAEARQQAGAHTICLDTPLPQYLRHGAEEE